MSAIVPSFLAKLDRAETHLMDLNDAIGRYGTPSDLPHPYTVRKRIEGHNKREVYRLHFMRSPANTDIPLIAADAIYNIRSSLEHLIAALAAAKDRDRLTFPVYWRGVWEPCVEGEDKRRRKARHVWRAIEKALPADAVAVLQRLQPPDDAGPDEKDHDLRILNHLSNTDRHAKLPVAASGVRTLQVRWKLPDGSEKAGLSEADPDSFVEDGAEIKDVPDGAVNMEEHGTPVVVIRLREKDVASHGRTVNIEIPGSLEVMVPWLRREVVDRLMPYVRAS
jgi:hypothetical protein